uniref:Uncharacterized protein n=1 Tax=Physcomitrium patens TaxID=3218 RepID=A9TGR8_PHYPA|nr:hypothetical protein PHYPA_006027 [Physcomitrium patens]
MSTELHSSFTRINLLKGLTPPSGNLSKLRSPHRSDSREKSRSKSTLWCPVNIAPTPVRPKVKTKFSTPHQCRNKTQKTTLTIPKSIHTRESAIAIRTSTRNTETPSHGNQETSSKTTSKSQTTTIKSHTNCYPDDQSLQATSSNSKCPPRGGQTTAKSSNNLEFYMRYGKCTE